MGPFGPGICVTNTDCNSEAKLLLSQETLEGLKRMQKRAKDENAEYPRRVAAGTAFSLTSFDYEAGKGFKPAANLL